MAMVLLDSMDGRDEKAKFTSTILHSFEGKITFISLGDINRM